MQRRIQMMKVVQNLTDEFSLTNCVVACEKDYKSGEHVMIRTTPSLKYVFTVRTHHSVVSGALAFSIHQMKWAGLSLNQDVKVSNYSFDSSKQYIGTMILEIDFLQKENSDSNSYDSDKMAIEFIQNFNSQAFCSGQQFVFSFCDKLFLLAVQSMEAMDPSILNGVGSSSKKSKIEVGFLLDNSHVIFEKTESSSINLVGKEEAQSMIKFNWNFEQLGIGGLDKEFSEIFYRVFASRILPQDVTESFDLTHVKGVLLFGPPGCGKTLMAREIGKMVNDRKPKVVNGPEIFSKFVGESEANIRKLFADAEDEQKRLGAKSGLHIIIFDEIGGISRQKGSKRGSTSVRDSVFKQLMSKIEALNNILVIGTTSRPDLLDKALLRPGRLEVQLEIGLPDESSRAQILNIHTAKMRQSNKLTSDVDIEELAWMTQNFTGADLAGLVRAAQSRALSRVIKFSNNQVRVDTEKLQSLQITWSDFSEALKNDIKSIDWTEKVALKGWEDDEECDLLVEDLQLIRRRPPFNKKEAEEVEVEAEVGEEEEEELVEEEEELVEEEEEAEEAVEIAVEEEEEEGEVLVLF